MVANSTLGASYNSEGVEEQVRLGAQLRLYRTENPALRENFLFLGVNPSLNPTAARVGPSIELQPATFFNLEVKVEVVDYFGTLGTIPSFPSALSDSSAAARERASNGGEGRGAIGARVSITPFFQFKLGPAVLRNRFTVEHFSVSLPAGDTVFYEPAYDTLAPGNGLFLSDDLDLFFVSDLPPLGSLRHGRVAAGARYTALAPVFNASHFRPGEDPAHERNAVHRVGPLVAWTLFDDGYSRFNHPTIVAMAQWYAAHPNRTGKDEAREVPYLVLAFLFQSDLWTSQD